MEIHQNEEVLKSIAKARFGIVGLGNIGMATAKGLLNSGLLSPGQLWISNRSRKETEQKSIDLITANNVVVAEDNFTLVRSCNTIIIALKQTQMKEELTAWKENKILDKDTLVVSFAAGVRIDTIKKWVGNLHQPVIRIMPNTPIAVGKGVFGWTVSDEVTVGQIKMFQYLLSNLGTECLVVSDDDIDKITAISGSGPAYFYLVAEHMIEAARKMGMTDDNAVKLVRDTFIGAAELLMRSGESPTQLRQRITSKGGTTEAAIGAFNSHNLSEIIQDGMNAARNRAHKLGQYFDSL